MDRETVVKLWNDFANEPDKQERARKYVLYKKASDKLGESIHPDFDDDKE
jgi:hypothetical protein